MCWSREHHRRNFSIPPDAHSRRGCRRRTHRLTSAVTVLSALIPWVFENSPRSIALARRAEMVVGRGSFTEAFPLFGLNLKDYIRYLRRNGFASEAARNEFVHWSANTVAAHRPGRLSTSAAESLRLAGVAGHRNRSPEPGRWDCRSWLPSLAANTAIPSSRDIYRNMPRAGTRPTSSNRRSCLGYVAETRSGRLRFYPVRHVPSAGAAAISARNRAPCRYGTLWRTGIKSSCPCVVSAT